jgi:transcription elongation factor GreA
MQKVPMTLRGYEALQAELKNLKSNERPAIIQAIAEAREHGDLSENAEYHAARERQSFVEGRIAELEDQTSRAEVIDPSKIAGDTIKFGAKVAIADCETDEESEYTIVGELEADIAQKLISVTSPMARAMIGKSVGDVFEVHSPGGTRDYEVVSISFN